MMPDRPRQPERWRPGRVACKPIPGGFALVDIDWRGDGEICRVMHGSGSQDPIDLKDRWFFIATIASAWNDARPYADFDKCFDEDGE